jgi:hypothetical protein
MHRCFNRALLAAPVFVAAIAMLAPAAAVLAAQSAAPAAVTPAQAAPFLGDWVVTAEGQQGPLTFALAVKVTDGKVAAEISSDQMPAKQAITDITKTGEILTLKYALDYQGNSVPVMITLTPAAETLKVSFDFAGGQFTLAGTGAKKK